MPKPQIEVLVPKFEVERDPDGGAMTCRLTVRRGVVDESGLHVAARQFSAEKIVTAPGLLDKKFATPGDAARSVAKELSQEVAAALAAAILSAVEASLGGRGL